MHHSCMRNAAPTLSLIALLLLQYKLQLSRIRQKAIDDMDVVKRRDGLDFVNVDPAKINFKL